MKPHYLSRTLKNFGYLLCVLVIVLSVSPPVFAGKLNDFEEDVVKEQEEQKPPKHHEDDDDKEPGFFASLFRGIARGIVGALCGSDDADREPGASDHGKPEFNGQPDNAALLPWFRLDAGYQPVASEVRAFDARAELGLYRLGLQGRFTYYHETDPADDLRLIQLHGLWHLPVSQQVQIGLGAGAVMLGGEEWNSGFSLTSPILIYPKEFLGVEFRPSWSWIHGNPISDYDLGVVLSHSHVGLRLGYRWVKSAHESLDGPYFGVSVRF